MKRLLLVLGVLVMAAGNVFGTTAVDVFCNLWENVSDKAQKAPTLQACTAIVENAGDGISESDAAILMSGYSTPLTSVEKTRVKKVISRAISVVSYKALDDDASISEADKKAAKDLIPAMVSSEVDKVLDKCNTLEDVFNNMGQLFE